MTEADILVVEDDKSIQNFIKITLKSGDMAVSWQTAG